MMAPRKKDPEDFWRKEINKMTGPFPEIGNEPPIAEVVEVKPTVDPDITGNFSKITMNIYFFLNPETNKYFTMQSQTMTDFGELKLSEAAEMVRRAKKKTKD